MKFIRPLALITMVSVLLGGIVACGSPSLAGKPDAAANPDVLILVNAQSEGAGWVSITYPNVVKHSLAQKHLSGLVAGAGWRAENVTVTDESVMASGKNPMTSVQFMAPQIIDPATAILAVEPVVKAYKDYKNIQLIYLVPPNTRLRAMGSYENKYVAITFTGSTGTYRYGIRVKDPSFDALNLPVPGFSRTSGAPGGQNTILRTVVVVLIVLLAFGIAILAFVFTSRSTAGRGGTKSS